MQKKDCYRVGSISKTYSFRGEVIVHFDQPNRENYEKLESVFVEQHNKLVPFFIEQIRFDRNEDFARVKFEGIDDDRRAADLLRCPVFIAIADATNDENDSLTPESLKGYAVADLRLGEIGHVAAFIDSGTNPLLDVTGPKGNTFIPFQEAFILGIDHESTTIKVDLPEGLVGLND